MLQILKQLFLFIYLYFIKRKQIDALVKSLTSKTRKQRRIIDVPEIPPALDYVTELPSGWSDTISFLGFDKNGLCAQFEVARHAIGSLLTLSLAIPGEGQFSFEESVTENDETGCGERFATSKLKIQCLQPMRRWQLRFNGPFIQTNDNLKRVHASVYLYWQCLSDPFDHFAKSACWSLARRLSSLTLRDMHNVCNNNTLWYSQWGELRGSINIDGKSMNVRLKTMRERILRPPDTADVQRVSTQYVVVDQSGHAFASSLVSYQNISNVYFGCMTFPVGDSHPLETERSGIYSNGKMLNLFHESQKLVSCNKTYYQNEKFKRICFSNENSAIEFKTFIVNEQGAYGIQLTSDLAKKIYMHQTLESKNRGNYDENNKDMLLNLDQKACEQRYLVGGKAAQLSILKSLSCVNVPQSICLTVNAFREHVKGSKELDAAIDDINACSRHEKPSKVKETCKKAVHLFENIPLADTLKGEIKYQLDCVFGDWTSQTFAVRSSSINEDGRDFSCAGQMATLLCVDGFESIINAIKICWASSVSYQAVEYRRQNGQKLTEGMGVIIQEMVNAEVAGVLFTNDPLSGDESRMIINACHGLGEAIVSGRVTPDTVVIKRHGDMNLEIEETQIGEERKGSMMHDTSTVIKGDSNTISDLKLKRLCLKEKEIILICQEGLKIEKLLRHAVDIEWAFSKGTLYILQSRPILAADMATDDEILHEFDSPVVGDDLLITTANIQEMMPGAVSTLSSDIFISAMDRAFKCLFNDRLGIKLPVHPTTIICTFSGNPFVNLTPSSVIAINSIAGEKAKANVEVFLVGQTVHSHTLETIRAHFGRSLSFRKKVKHLLTHIFVNRRKYLKLFKQLEIKANAFIIGEGASTAEQLYGCIDDNLVQYFEMWRMYVHQASESSLWSGVIMGILKGESKDMNTDNLADLALILSMCKDVYSAEVPTAINCLATLIRESEIKDEFLELPSDKCDSFLRNAKQGTIKSEYIRFMERHGHRGIREAEFLEQSWAQNPATLIDMVKKVIIQGQLTNQVRKSRSTDEIVQSLRTPLSPTKKLILKRFIIEKAMNGVCSRELGKSVCIKFSNVFKAAYWRLAQLMVNESRLPDSELLFFLTHSEIDELIESRSAKLVRLAKRRLKIYPKMNDMYFQKINIGLPQPICDRAGLPMDLSDSTLYGMPVCLGKTIGRACVLTSQKDADQIKQGDILICKYTDVGWSPYFSLINGLVTELGGLLSHGAVVARECGIPCIVNMSNVTAVIKTGDMVELNGTSGTLRKQVHV